MKKPILQFAVPTPLRRYFDYYPPAGCDVTLLQPGMRFKVPFGRRELVGVYLQTKTQADVSAHKIKPALALLDEVSLLPHDLLALAMQAAHYYHYPVGEVLASLFPSTLRQGKPVPAIKSIEKSTALACEPSLTLNSAQAEAVKRIKESENTVINS